MELLEKILDAHGGRVQWEKYQQVSATMIGGGTLLTTQEMPQNNAARTITVWLHEQRAGMQPFGSSPDVFSVFTPQRVAVENEAGSIIAERTGNPEILHQQMKRGIWGPLGLATFNGYAMWQYLNVPFFMLFPKVKIKEIKPYTERNETWRVLEVTFPEDLMSHSRVQQFYFDENFLLRRQDYTVDVAVEEKNTFNVAQYAYDYKEVQGLKMPTIRRMYHRNEDCSPDLLNLAIWVDLSDIKYA